MHLGFNGNIYWGKNARTDWSLYRKINDFRNFYATLLNINHNIWIHEKASLSFTFNHSYKDAEADNRGISNDFNMRLNYMI